MKSCAGRSIDPDESAEILNAIDEEKKEPFLKRVGERQAEELKQLDYYVNPKIKEETIEAHTYRDSGDLETYESEEEEELE